MRTASAWRTIDRRALPASMLTAQMTREVRFLTESVVSLGGVLSRPLIRR
jgi:hypothetical protein